MMRSTNQSVVLAVVLFCMLTSYGLAEQPNEAIGYPRPFSFREINPKNLPHLDDMAMVVSDLHLRTHPDKSP